MQNKQEIIKSRYDKILEEVQQGVRDAHTQTRTRQALIEKIESKLGSKLIVYVAKPNFPIDYNDITIVGSMLASVGEADTIDLIIQSGGGVGTVAEKVVEMIRQYAKKEFRVVVPNLAKRAATMIALGSNKIFMGVTSELGPIDPQILTIQGGVQHWISAQSFIDARDRLEKLTSDSIKKNEPFQAYIAQLSAINSGFIDHCEKSMMFAKDFATKCLSKCMLSGQPDAENLSAQIAQNLCSTSTYFTHGRTISAQFMKDHPPLDKLNVEYLEKESEVWSLLFELYLRCELFLDMDNQPGQRKGKLFEAGKFSMVSLLPA
jgi:ClpP class serine protease